MLLVTFACWSAVFDYHSSKVLPILLPKDSRSSGTFTAYSYAGPPNASVDPRREEKKRRKRRGKKKGEGKRKRERTRRLKTISVQYGKK